MKTKPDYRQQALKYRREGLSYAEILIRVPVAKSTLSLWLRDVGLSSRQKSRLTEKKRLAQIKGGLARKTQRINLQKDIYKRSREEIGKITKRELWLIGIALYWAEGSKEKEYRPGSGVLFSNSDPLMIQVFIKWLKDCCGVGLEFISFEIHIHRIHEKQSDRVRAFWSQTTGIPIVKFSKVYFKKHNIKTNRKNSGDLYNGVLRVKVLSSSILNRRISGWVMGIINS